MHCVGQPPRSGTRWLSTRDRCPPIAGGLVTKLTRSPRPAASRFIRGIFCAIHTESSSRWYTERESVVGKVGGFLSRIKWKEGLGAFQVEFRNSSQHSLPSFMPRAMCWLGKRNGGARVSFWPMTKRRISFGSPLRFTYTPRFAYVYVMGNWVYVGVMSFLLRSQRFRSCFTLE